MNESRPEALTDRDRFCAFLSEEEALQRRHGPAGLFLRPLAERVWSAGDWAEARNRPTALRAALQSRDVAPETLAEIGRGVAVDVQGALEAKDIYGPREPLLAQGAILSAIDNEVGGLEPELRDVLERLALLSKAYGSHNLYDVTRLPGLACGLAASERLTVGDVRLLASFGSPVEDTLMRLIANPAVGTDAMRVAFHQAPALLGEVEADAVAAHAAGLGREDVLGLMCQAPTHSVKQAAWRHCRPGTFRTAITGEIPSAWSDEAVLLRLRAGALIDLPEEYVRSAVGSAVETGVPVAELVDGFTQSADAVIGFLLEHPNRQIRVEVIGQLNDRGESPDPQSRGR